MNKEHFLIELKIYLKPLSQEQQLFFLDKYEEIFNERILNGESEELIAKELGKPIEIAEELLKEFNIPVSKKKIDQTGWYEVPSEDASYNYQQFAYQEEKMHPQKTTGIQHFFKVAMIFCLNFFFIIWIIFTFLMLLFAGWLVAGAFVMTPAFSAFQFLFTPIDMALFQLFVSICLFGIGIIGILILIPLTKLFFKGLKRYFVWTFHMIKGDM